MASIDPRQLAALVQAARSSSGAPQPGAIPQSAPDLNSLLAGLKGGASASVLMQLLALLAGMGGSVPGAAGPSQAGPGMSPIEQAMLQSQPPQ